MRYNVSVRCLVYDFKIEGYCYVFIAHTQINMNMEKKVKERPGSATITDRSPFKTPRGSGNRQIQTSTNSTNIRKALRLALSSPSEVIAMLKGL